MKSQDETKMLNLLQKILEELSKIRRAHTLIAEMHGISLGIVTIKNHDKFDKIMDKILLSNLEK